MFKASPLIVDGLRENGSKEDGNNSSPLHLGAPDDVDISIELKDSLFALEGAQEMADRCRSPGYRDSHREERSWHTTFGNIHVKAKSSPKHLKVANIKPGGRQRYPVELITVGMDSLQILKPMARQERLLNAISEKGILQNDLPESEKQTCSGNANVNLAADIVASEDDGDDLMANFSLKEPIEAVVKKVWSLSLGTMYH